METGRENAEESQLARFYSGKNILLTGGTGFLGKLTVQKLLRSCPRVKGIYLLIREKKGKSAEERLDEMLNNVVFDATRNDVPDFRIKLHAVAGNLEYDGLALKTYDRKMLTEEIDIVLHSAATVTFQLPLRHAINSNVKGTQELLNLCEEMKHLVAVMIMSTAYSFCTRGVIGEVFMKPPIKPETAFRLVDDLDDETLEKLTPTLLGIWPNTYTYTKAIMEDIVRSRIGRLPIGMYRPSIVLPTYKDPLEGWVDGINGPIGVSIAVGMGITHVLYCDGRKRPDFVPGDYCVNGFLAATHDIYQKYLKQKTPDQSSLVFNCVATPKYSIDFNLYNHYGRKYLTPVPNAIWDMCVHFTLCPVIYFFMAVLTHFIPAIFIDAFSLITGRKPRLLKTCILLERNRKLFKYFISSEWNMRHDNFLDLWKRLNSLDKEIFPFDITSLEWEDFYKNYPKGVCLYVLQVHKMDKEAKEKLQKRSERVKTIHRIFLVCLYLLLTFLFFHILHCVLGFVGIY